MPVAVRIPYPDGIYFITFTCYKWLPLFEKTNGYGHVYCWFDHLRKQGHFIIGYVIMPNHVHTLIGFQNTGRSINRTVGEGKRFMAYDIVQELIELQETAILNLLAAGVCASDRKRGKVHEVWEDSFDWKECNNQHLIDQKLNYMHENPCSGKWNLADNPADYLHSSAKYYITGHQGIYPITNSLEMEDINLTAKWLADK